MRFLSLILAILSTAALLRAAEAIPLTDTTIIPGKRVGPIKSDSTLASLKSLLGENQVKPDKFPGAEGETIEGVKLFADTDRELHVFFEEEADESEDTTKAKGPSKPISFIRIIGKAWKFSNGLRLDLKLTEVEKINGKPFAISGFGWDYGGYANLEGGKISTDISLRFNSGDRDLHDSLVGDRQISTSSKQLRALNPVLSEISLSLC